MCVWLSASVLVFVSVSLSVSASMSVSVSVSSVFMSASVSTSVYVSVHVSLFVHVRLSLPSVFLCLPATMSQRVVCVSVYIQYLYVCVGMLTHASHSLQAPSLLAFPRACLCNCGWNYGTEIGTAGCSEQPMGYQWRRRLVRQHPSPHLLNSATRCNTLQHTASHYSTLWHTATHCNTLQHTATHCNGIQWQTQKLSNTKAIKHKSLCV